MVRDPSGGMGKAGILGGLSLETVAHGHDERHADTALVEGGLTPALAALERAAALEILHRGV